MSTLYLLGVLISGFLPLSKSAKWTRRIWEVLSIWVSMMESIPYKYSESLTHALQVMRLCLYFVSAWYGWTVIMNDKNDLIDSGLLWVGRLYWIYFLLHHEDPNILMGNVLVKHINGPASETKEITQSISHLGFHRGSRVKKRSYRSPDFVAHSTPTLEMVCTVEL